MFAVSISKQTGADSRQNAREDENAPGPRTGARPEIRLGLGISLKSENPLRED